MSIELDPQEVLEHLYSLGYYNITKEQLKEFMKDLKKLIKYDLRKEERKNRLMRENDKISDKENICICSVSTPTKDENKAHKVTSSCLADLKKDSRCISCNEQPVNKKHSSFFGEVQSKHQKPRTVVPTSEPCECRNSYLGGEPCFSKKFRSSIHDGASSSEEYSHPCDKTAQKNRKETCASIKKTTSSLKPCPSFIRSGSAKVKPPKADPVALYHYYKSLWSQHNLPGENSHEELRWRIRHKMMTAPVLAKGQSEDKVTKKPDWVVT
ncbi:hyls1 centriolar and ciliogenesis associated isoform X2 [Rhodnius prolixus]|uniref:Centriolar and ciliogenesis-associated protein HYLS1 C-terminal domain-containing protein n=1 Tax=Rhodnius prolixus TaxID=13249 RepID=T1I8R2_RHOPR